MAKDTSLHLSRRERQIMDIIYARGSASVEEVLQAIPDRPSYSAVRALMRILEQKGHLRHRCEGKKYVFLPTRSRQSAARAAVARLLQTFFDGSAERAVAAMLASQDARPSDEELERLAQLIERVRQEGR